MRHPRRQNCRIDESNASPTNHEDSSRTSADPSRTPSDASEQLGGLDSVLVRAHPADTDVELGDETVLAGRTDRETTNQGAVSKASHTDGAVTGVNGPVPDIWTDSPQQSDGTDNTDDPSKRRS